MRSPRSSGGTQRRASSGCSARRRTAARRDARSACGGCVFRAVSYAREAEIKRAAADAMLSRVGFPVRTDSIVTGPPDGYRNKAVFHLSPEGKIGVYAASTHRLLPLAGGNCRLCPPFFGALAAMTEDFFGGSNPYFSALSIRTAQSGRFTAALHTDNDNADALSLARRWADAAAERFPSLEGAFCASGAPDDPRVRYTALRGEDALTDVFCGLTLRISPAAFYQINHAVAEELCRTAAEFAALRPGERAADLYCGIGTIGMVLAAGAPEASVIGIEVNESAVRDAEENRLRNLLTNVRFRCADSAAVAGEAERFDCIVIDPPRAGCSSRMRQTLAALSPDRIVYVSCNPATMARDMAELANAGYAPVRARALDMFPRAGHVETVVSLSRK